MDACSPCRRPPCWDAERGDGDASEAPGVRASSFCRRAPRGSATETLGVGFERGPRPADIVGGRDGEAEGRGVPLVPSI